MRTYKEEQPIQKTKDFKPRRINTYVIVRCNPFRIRTYEK
jgi:hypothetical protein